MRGLSRAQLLFYSMLSCGAPKNGPNFDERIPLPFISIVSTGALMILCRTSTMMRISDILLIWCTVSLVIVPIAIANDVTKTPIKHVVVIFQENVSFDHYFGTYPDARNPPGEPRFVGAPDTPSVNGLTPDLLTHNPNSAPPFRLDRSQPLTCDMDHSYTDEQKAFDDGRADKFVEWGSNRNCNCDQRLVMGYYDGNTVTALWEYAQHFALSDNFYDGVFGPSTPGAINLVSGQTHGADPPDLEGLTIQGTVIGDPDPSLDDCSEAVDSILMKGRTIGDLLNAKEITWGWFQGGFQATARTPKGKAICGSTTRNTFGIPIRDYVPHHEPFQYYEQDANPHHLPPSSWANIGRNDQANHQYDIQDFWHALDRGNLPAVSFVKAPAAQDGHAGYSGPLDEQGFLVETINRLEAAPEWRDMAVILAWDDSDGWYDHQMPPIVMGSATKADALNRNGLCGKPSADSYGGRCGHGPRLPLLVISPYARANFVDHTLVDQTSILRFIEDNWGIGRIGNQSYDAIAGSLEGMFEFERTDKTPPLTLDSCTGEPQ
jgi:phospholipase C